MLGSLRFRIILTQSMNRMNQLHIFLSKRKVDLRCFCGQALHY